jgi:uncharacterized protein (TIGR02466 family)
MAVGNESWCEVPEVVRLFPTFVWKCRLSSEVYKAINAAILNRLGDMRRGLPPPEWGTAWQSGTGLHKFEEFHPLVSCIDAAVERVLNFLRIGHTAFQITGCWANINAPGAAHKMHSHPNNFLSGVYYVQVPDRADTINFHDPRPETGIIRPPVIELTAYNTDQVVVTVKDGTLIMFPAWLPHSVDSNRSGQMRISVSFNVMFSSFAETMGQPLWGGSDPSTIGP